MPFRARLCRAAGYISPVAVAVARVQVRRRRFRLGGSSVAGAARMCGGAPPSADILYIAVCDRFISFSIVFIVMFCLMHSFFIFSAIIDGS